MKEKQYKRTLRDFMSMRWYTKNLKIPTVAFCSFRPEPNTKKHNIAGHMNSQSHYILIFVVLRDDISHLRANCFISKCPCFKTFTIIINE